MLFKYSTWNLVSYLEIKSIKASHGGPVITLGTRPQQHWECYTSSADLHCLSPLPVRNLPVASVKGQDDTHFANKKYSHVEELFYVISGSFK